REGVVVVAKPGSGRPQPHLRANAALCCGRTRTAPQADILVADPDRQSKESHVFASLSDRLTATFKSLRGKGRLSEADIEATVKQIRRALLDADVAVPAVRAFTSGARTRFVGRSVAGAEPGSAGRQDRARAAHRDSRWGLAGGVFRQASAHGHHAGRSPGCR